MLNGVIDWSLRHRFIVLLAAALFVAAGLVALTSVNVDAFPDTTPVQVQINSPSPGLAPEEVEQQVTFPVEQSLGGMPKLTEMRSISRYGLSQVVVTFADGTDIYFARQQIAERLAGLEGFEGPTRPKMGPIATGLGEVFHYALREDHGDLVQTRSTQDWIVRPALRTVPGTAEINSWGGYQKEYLVRVDPHRLIKHGITFDQVLQAVRDNNLNVGGGYIAQSGENLLVSGIARTHTVDQIRDVVIAAREGVPITVRDVAGVEEGHALPTGGVTADGKGPVVLGLGFMLMGENSHAVTYRIKQKFEQVRQTLPPHVHLETLYDRTELVDHVIDTVRRNLCEGGLLVIVVLFLFLGNFRAGLIVAAAIPLSMLFAFCGMYQFGIAASLLSLGALDFGLVVDSSVVMIENVVRHLSLEDTGAAPRDHTAVVRDAAVEVRTPTMFGELIIMIVYLPILTLEGVEGKMFRPMALTVIFALAGSLVLSLTVMPVLASLVLPTRMTDSKPWLVRLAEWLYIPVLKRALSWRYVTLGLALAGLAVAVMMARGLGSEFIPRLSEGALVIGIKRPPSTSLDEAMRTNTAMQNVLLAEFGREIRHVWGRCGTAEVATDPMGFEETDMFISLTPRDRWRPEIGTQDELARRIEDAVKFFPGQTINVSQPIEQRVNEMISGVRTDVAVDVFGDDLKQLRDISTGVMQLLSGIHGAVDVARAQELVGQPVFQVKVKQAELARYGVSARAVLDLIESLGSKVLGEVIEGQLRFPLVIRLPEAVRQSPEAVGAILVSTASGERIPLSRLASFAVVEGPAEIGRAWGQRRVTVTCNVRERDIGSFIAEAQRQVAEKITPTLPGGRYRIEWGGQFENLRRAQGRLMVVVPLALLLIFGLLRLTYPGIRDVLLVFSAVPFACVGGVVSLWLRDMPFSISAAVGFVALSGVSVLNSMLMVTFIRHLLERGDGLAAALEEAARERVRPVLMTALVASLGFLPMAMSTGMGAEVQRPLATVVIGGVISSTTMTLLVLPVLYEIFGDRMGRPAK